MKHLYQKLMLAALSGALAIASTLPAFGQIPKGYWQYQQPFESAREAGNTSEIIRLGNEILPLFTNQPMDNDKAGILYTVSEAMYPAYEKQGNYQKAIECLNTVITCGTELGFSDGVKLAKARIQKIDPQTEVYAFSSNVSSIPNFNAKYEPRAGAYFGRTYAKNNTAPMANETAVSFYVEFLQDNIADYDYLIRPFDDGSRVIHIALNMPNENDSLKAAVTADSYINDFVAYVGTLKSPVFIRIGGEMNVWQNLADPALYKQVYIKIATAARAQAPGAALLFSPNDISNWNTDIESYYPGDSYVDWVGVSLYTDKFRDAKNPVQKEDFEEMYYGNGAYSNPITKLRNIVQLYGTKKPIIITEGGSGHSVYGNSNLDLNAYAKNRIHMLYTYANMVYPQIKGIIYFDNDLVTGKYNYSLSQKPELMAQYTQSTQTNKSLVTQMNKSNGAYVKLGNYSDSLPEIELATYCILPGNIIVTVNYELDGQNIASSKTIPFPVTIPAASLTEGAHSLKVTIKGENGYQKVKNYSLTKANGNVSVKQNES